ncbi:MAG TPA: hypothetical protein VHO25_25100 [Polyangiaceae bacterium]|nr:hypothetical protein [Polyangiaceae bacterium]
MTVIHWNGHDLPAELRDLPAGTYAIQEAAEVLTLTLEEDAGLAQAVGALQGSSGVAQEAVRARVLRHI